MSGLGGLAVAVAVGCAALAGCAAPAAETSGAAGTPAPAVTASPHPGLDSFAAGRDFHRVAEPVRLSIAKLGLTSGLERLARAQDGTLEVPAGADSVGWFTGGPRPGEPGPAVLLGHVDLDGAPAVFFRLHELAPGDEIVVDAADGTAATFRVTGIEQHAKAEFPTDAVYSPSGEAELRLITCGGAFDAGTGHYRDNVIVFAELV